MRSTNKSQSADFCFGERQRLSAPKRISSEPDHLDRTPTHAIVRDYRPQPRDSLPDHSIRAHQGMGGVAVAHDDVVHGVGLHATKAAPAVEALQDRLQ